MAQSKWIKLPCHCGDKVYIVNRKLGKVFEHTVVGFLVGPESPRRNFILTRYINKYHCETKMRWGFNTIGTVVFFSEEDANAKLAEPIEDVEESKQDITQLIGFGDDDADCYCE